MQTYLEKIFGSRIRAKLIGWLFSHADESFTARQMAELLAEKATSLGRELSRLNRDSILLVAREGRVGRFRANPSFVFYPELRQLVLKTVGVPGQLGGALAALPGVCQAFIYGCCVREDEQADCDIDLMIIGDINCDMLDVSMAEVEKRLGRTVNCMVYGSEEFAAKVEVRNRFLLDVLEDDLIMLIGRREDLPAT